jgi:predicted ester cyclase
MTGFLQEYPDMRVQIEDIIAESNKVAARIIWRGTNKNSGELFHQMGIVILHLNEADQIVERWSAYTPI